MPHPVEVVRSAKRASALLHPDRLKLLELLSEPDSSAGLARKLDLPRQQVNYHLRELETLGLVEFVEERRKGNCVERIVRATARSYLISPEAIGRLGCGCDPCGCGSGGLVPLQSIAGAQPQTASDSDPAARLLTAAARLIHECGRGAGQSADEPGSLVMETEVSFASPAEQDAFAAELSAEVARIVAKYHRNCETNPKTMHLLVGAWASPSPRMQAAGRERPEETVL